MLSRLLRGAAAGAAGTTALNAVTYLDMVVRARPASSTPEKTVERTEELTGVTLSSDGPDSDAEQNRRSGLGALLGIATGLATGAVYGLVRPYVGGRVAFPLLATGAGLAANVGSVAPMAALGVDDPRSWSASSWLSDLLPHLAFGAVTAAVYERLTPLSRD
jgi:hypothetical protein